MDPNFLTKWEDVDFDQERINKIEGFKKLFAESQVNTTLFIKKAVMVPIKAARDGKLFEPRNAKHPFMRGIMNFDDYNYKSLNDFIFVKYPGESQETEFDLQKEIQGRKKSEKNSGKVKLTNETFS